MVFDCCLDIVPTYLLFFHFLRSSHQWRIPGNFHHVKGGCFFLIFAMHGLLFSIPASAQKWRLIHPVGKMLRPSPVWGGQILQIWWYQATKNDTTHLFPCLPSPPTGETILFDLQFGWLYFSLGLKQPEILWLVWPHFGEVSSCTAGCLVRIEVSYRFGWWCVMETYRPANTHTTV